MQHIPSSQLRSNCVMHFEYFRLMRNISKLPFVRQEKPSFVFFERLYNQIKSLCWCQNTSSSNFLELPGCLSQLLSYFSWPSKQSTREGYQTKTKKKITGLFPFQSHSYSSDLSLSNLDESCLNRSNGSAPLSSQMLFMFSQPLSGPLILLSLLCQ